jgi:hypothetical protein
LTNSANNQEADQSLIFRMEAAQRSPRHQICEWPVFDIAASAIFYMALACAGAPKRRSRPNVVRISDFKRRSI